MHMRLVDPRFTLADVQCDRQPRSRTPGLYTCPNRRAKVGRICRWDRTSGLPFSGSRFRGAIAELYLAHSGGSATHRPQGKAMHDSSKYLLRKASHYPNGIFPV